MEGAVSTIPVVAVEPMTRGTPAPDSLISTAMDLTFDSESTAL